MFVSLIFSLCGKAEQRHLVGHEGQYGQEGGISGHRTGASGCPNPSLSRRLRSALDIAPGSRKCLCAGLAQLSPLPWAVPREVVSWLLTGILTFKTTALQPQATL